MATSIIKNQTKIERSNQITLNLSTATPASTGDYYVVYNLFQIPTGYRYVNAYIYNWTFLQKIGTYNYMIYVSNGYVKIAFLGISSPPSQTVVMEFVVLYTQEN